jgi:WD40 repeat protein
MQFNPGANHHNTSGFILATHSRGTVRLWDSQNGSSAIRGFADLDTTLLGSGYKRYAWAPDGSRLLTRIDKETKVWSSVR